MTCGAYLARAGLKTLVLERRDVLGGAAVTEEVVPGFKFSVFSYLMSLLHPGVIADLELAKYGYKVLPATDMFAPAAGRRSYRFRRRYREDAGLLRALLREGRGDLS